MDRNNDLRAVYACAWPLSRLGEAVEQLVRRAALLPEAAPRQPWSASAPRPGASEDDVTQWLEMVAMERGFEAEAVQAPYPDADRLVRYAAPALYCLPPRLEGEAPRFLAALSGGWRGLTLVAPDATLRRVRAEAARAALCRELEAPAIEAIEDLLARLRVAPRRRARARRVMLAEQLGRALLPGCWLLRLPLSASWRGLARDARLPRLVATLAGGLLAHLALTLVTWWLIGRQALDDAFSGDLLVVWSFVVLTALLLQGMVTLVKYQVAVEVGGLFKRRLLQGALQLDPDDARRQGVGQFIGRVMESDAMEALALSGGFTALFALIELAMAGAILALGAGEWRHVGLLLLWLGATAVAAWRYGRRGRQWIDVYRAMTNDLVEQMTGHRTRLAQAHRDRWHDEEDRALDRYVRLSAQMDRLGTSLLALMPRGWPVLGLSGLAYTVLVAQPTPERLAISLGGVLLASHAFAQLTEGLRSSMVAALGWKQVQPLWRAAAQTPPPAGQGALSLRGVSLRGVDDLEAPVITMRDVSFRYPGSNRQVVPGCDLQIRGGDRLILQGPSGGGKSTLAALLAGLHEADAGLLLLRGYDRYTLGAAEWRRRVVVAPQFHENYVFSGSFAFNLLMARRWPPQPEDLAEAAAVCRELGLGPLLDRMPAGLQQIVGESGWQLSHGERSRLFIARALLQRADLLILDESLAALDPENAQRAIACASQRVVTLMVIAHP